jgi:hypothetical protein
MVEVSRHLLEKEAPNIPAPGDSLTIEFPDNTRAEGRVQYASPTTIAVSVNGSYLTWGQHGGSQVKDGGLLLITYVVK